MNHISNVNERSEFLKILFMFPGPGIMIILFARNFMNVPNLWDKISWKYQNSVKIFACKHKDFFDVSSSKMVVGNVRL